MKPAPYGRLLFGASAVLFGVIALLWHDADTWQSLRRIWSLPAGVTAGNCLMLAQIAAGIGLQIRRTAAVASIVLIAVYAVFALACVPAIVTHPLLYLTYGSFFEQFSLLCGALALFALAGRVRSLRGVVRIAFALCVVSFTLSQAFYLQLTAQLVPLWIPPDQTFWAVLTTVAFGLAAIAILFDVRARLATGLLAIMLLAFGVLVWIPQVAAHPQVHGNWSEMALTFLIAGSALIVRSVV